jgi:hypothetical protein
VGKVTAHLPSLPSPTAHDPLIDQMIAPGLVKLGWWGGTDEHEFLLAAGATGTPLTAADAEAMRTGRGASNNSAPIPGMNSSALASALGLAVPARTLLVTRLFTTITTLATFAAKKLDTSLSSIITKGFISTHRCIKITG